MADKPSDKIQVVRDDGAIVTVTRAAWDLHLSGQAGWSLKPKAAPKKKAAADSDAED